MIKNPGALPQARNDDAPLALNTYSGDAPGWYQSAPLALNGSIPTKRDCDGLSGTLSGVDAMHGSSPAGADATVGVESGYLLANRPNLEILKIKLP